MHERVKLLSVLSNFREGLLFRFSNKKQTKKIRGKKFKKFSRLSPELFNYVIIRKKREGPYNNGHVYLCLAG